MTAIGLSNKSKFTNLIIQQMIWPPLLFYNNMLKLRNKCYFEFNVKCMIFLLKILMNTLLRTQKDT